MRRLLWLLLVAGLQLVGGQAARGDDSYYTTPPSTPTAGGWQTTATLRCLADLPPTRQTCDERANPPLGRHYGIVADSILPHLHVELSWYSDSIARVQIQDPEKTRWSPERVLPDLIQLPPLPRRPSHSLLDVTAATDGSLGFTVKRAGFDAELFRLRQLYFADQLISLATPMPDSPTLYGLGEAKAPLKVPLGQRAIFNSDSGTRSGVPLYGTHAFFMDWRQAGGTLQSASTEIGDAGTEVLSGASTAVHGMI